MAKQQVKMQKELGSTEREIRFDSLFSMLGRIEVVQLVGAVLLLLVLIYTISEILSPFLVLGAIVFVLYPLRRYVLARNIMWLSIVLFSLWFLNSIANILAPFIISFIFAYMLNPVVNWFQRVGVARWISSLILILLFIGIVTLVIFFVVPIALTQLEGVLAAVAKLLNEYREMLWNSDFIRILERYGISAKEIRSTFERQLTPRFEDIVKAAVAGLGSLMSSISAFITQIFYIIIIPFLTFYFLADFPLISERFQKLFPRHTRDRVVDFLGKADELIGHYLRGVLLVALFQAIAVAVFFSIIGIKYSLLLGLLAGVFDLIPYFGLVAILILSAVAALFSDPPILLKLAFAVGTIGFLHIMEVTLLSPKIVGSKVGLHPLLIILSLLVFMYFLGFVGLLIAIPITALILLFIKDWEDRRKGKLPQYRTPM
ncbi:MAG: AI-2E family transporter [Bacteroidetes bacterium]|nr:AI-2E family transporter [Bacteroidota bacterium]